MSTYLNQIREYLHNGPFSEERTHIMEMFTLMKDGLDDLALLESAHYEADGLKATLKFADKKTYEVTIREVRP